MARLPRHYEQPIDIVERRRRIQHANWEFYALRKEDSERFKYGHSSDEEWRANGAPSHWAEALREEYLFRDELLTA